jgi:redox-sensitive bicupin YhaK (pirin superfamily)
MNVDVRPHPHIGLATVTYLFEGAMMHRDSLGSVQRIEPGAINWMSAGRGIVHSERTPPDLRAVRHRSHGLQLWVGLPQAMEESAPTFSHTPAAQLAPFAEQGSAVSVLVGEGFGRISPVRAASPTLFLMIHLKSNAELCVPVLAPELAVYPLEHAVSVNDAILPARTLGVLEGDRPHVLRSSGDTTVAVIGGAPLDGARILSWNFVSSTKSRIERAAEEWRLQRMGSVPGETDYIPLPDQLPT